MYGAFMKIIYDNEYTFLHVEYILNILLVFVGKVLFRFSFFDKISFEPATYKCFVLSLAENREKLLPRFYITKAMYVSF